MTELITQLQEIVGTKNIITDPADMAPYCDDWRAIIQASPQQFYYPPLRKW